VQLSIANFKRLFNGFSSAKKTKNGWQDGEFFVYLFGFLTKKRIGINYKFSERYLKDKNDRRRKKIGKRKLFRAKHSGT
jgi:hypothetical protein